MNARATPLLPLPCAPEALAELSRDPDNLLVLRGHGGRARKHWRRGLDGAPEKVGERPPAEYLAGVLKVDSIELLGKAWGWLQTRTDTVAVLGGLAPAGALEVARGRRIRRRKLPREGAPAHLEERATRTLVLDVDDADTPSGYDMSTPEGRAGAVRAFLATLPAPLAGASCWAQWTGSAGVRGWAQLKLRLVYRLARPLTPAEQKAWLAWAGVPADPAIYHAAQPIYVARPSFGSGLGDPLPGKARLFFLAGEREEVDIPPVELARATARKPATPKATVRRSGEVWRAPAYPHGRDDVTARGEAALGAALGSLRSTRGSRHAAVREAARRYAGPAVAGGHCSAELARSLLLRAAARLGLGGERLRQAEAAISWGLERGGTAARPEEAAQPDTPRWPWGSRPTEHDVRRGGAERVAPWFAGVVKKAKAKPEELLVAQVPAGAGKTHGAVEEACAAVGGGETRAIFRAGETRAIFTRTLNLAEEAAALAREISPATPVRVLRGALHDCKIAAEYRSQLRAGDEAAELLLNNLAHAYAEGGRVGLCGRPDDPTQLCEHYENCPGAARPTVAPGELIVATLDLAPHLKLPEETVSYVDESPRAWRPEESLGAADLLTLREQGGTCPRCAGRAGLGGHHSPQACWSRRFHAGGDAGGALTKLSEILAILPHTHPAGEHARYLLPRELSLAALDPAGALAALGAAAVAEEERAAKTRERRGRFKLVGAGPENRFAAPPAALPVVARAGERPQIPSRAAHRLLLDFSAAAAKGAWPEDVGVRVEPDGTATFVRWGRVRLPPGAVIALDATASSNATQWDALARQNGRRGARIQELSLIGGAPTALHVRTTTLRTASLFTRTRDGKLRWGARAVGAFRKVAAELEDATTGWREASELRLGILAKKPVARLLRAALHDGVDVSEYRSDRHAQAVLDDRLVARLHAIEDAGGKVVIGHYGADDVGSNRFKKCNFMLLMGAPTAEMGAAKAELEMLGVAELAAEQKARLAELPGEEREAVAEELREAALATAYRASTQGKISQAVARLRAIRRDDECRVLYIGATPPAEDDRCCPGLSWARRDITKAPAASEAAVYVEALAERELQATGELMSLGSLEALGVTKAEARGIQKRLKETRADWLVGGGARDASIIDESLALLPSPPIILQCGHPYDPAPPPDLRLSPRVAAWLARRGWRERDPEPPERAREEVGWAAAG